MDSVENYLELSQHIKRLFSIRSLFRKHDAILRRLRHFSLRQRVCLRTQALRAEISDSWKTV